MNKYQESLNYIIDNYVDMHYEGKPMNEETKHALRLQMLVDKAALFEWIPVTERLPEEHDSIFAHWYGTDNWNRAYWRTTSGTVIVTVEFNNGHRVVKTSYTHDGEWYDEKRNSNCKVIAWKPLPKPYKGER